MQYLLCEESIGIHVSEGGLHPSPTPLPLRAQMHESCARTRMRVRMHHGAKRGGVLVMVGTSLFIPGATRYRNNKKKVVCVHT